ncbi:MAG: hypothetical protein L6365_08825 [Desulfobulbaceae bacterium]|nr:hypothetical protein [Desulfobulbaceae bacterium]
MSLTACSNLSDRLLFRIVTVAVLILICSLDIWWARGVLKAREKESSHPDPWG